MKLQTYIVAGLLALSLISCDKTEKFKVNVNLENADGKTVYLQKAVSTNVVTLDSSIVENGKAVLSAPFDDIFVMYGLNCKGWRRPLMFFADNKDVNISGDFQKYYDVKIAASESQNRLDDFTAHFNAFDTQMEQAHDSLKKLQNTNALESEIAAAQEKLTTIEDEQKAFVFNQVWDNNKDFVSHYILYRYKWMFEPCEVHYTRNNFDTTVYSPYIDLLDAYLAKLDRVAEGQQYTDFSMKNVDGNEVSLSSLVGQQELLLIDFWASWCPDCRIENPSVVALYNDFHSKGFDVLSISLDNNRDAWLKGIEQDGLIWNNHLCDLKGWSNSAADIYAVVAIPATVLLDKDGIIVAKNLHGADLRQFVEDKLK